MTTKRDEFVKLLDEMDADAIRHMDARLASYADRLRSIDAASQPAAGEAVALDEPNVKLCPRPINGADDDSAAWCVMTGNCGCDHAYKLCARGRHVAYALRKGGSIIGLRELDWSPDSWELRECEIVPLYDGQRTDAYHRLHSAFQKLLLERDQFERACRDMVSAQHAGQITDEMAGAWDRAHSLILSVDNGRMRSAK